MRIQKIKIQNLKDISEYEADFNGCTAIITAKNNGGKTTFLQAVPNRVRFIRPDVVVKSGSTQGSGEMTLTDGSKFVWEFDSKGKDKLTFISKENIKQNVTKELGSKYFPSLFDIDKFLQSSPKEQAKQLQKIVGVDFTDVDARYLAAYNERTTRNAESERYHVKLGAMLKVDEAKPVDVTKLNEDRLKEKGRLNQLYLTNKKANEDALKVWEDACRVIDENVKKFNKEEAQKLVDYNSCTDAVSIIKKHGCDLQEVDLWLNEKANQLNKQKSALDLYATKPPQPDPMPVGKELELLDSIEKQITDAANTNEKARQYKEYVDYKASTEQAAILAQDADDKVKAIELERNNLIASAKFPKGISITNDGITIDGFPLNKDQISTSKIYCAALRIASMNLGEVKTLYFDASFLDRNSLAEIELWANENDLQLLIERPDFEGGEIKYELIENETMPLPANKDLNTAV